MNSGAGITERLPVPFCERYHTKRRTSTLHQLERRTASLTRTLSSYLERCNSLTPSNTHLSLLLKEERVQHSQHVQLPRIALRNAIVVRYTHESIHYSR